MILFPNPNKNKTFEKYQVKLYRDPRLKLFLIIEKSPAIWLFHIEILSGFFFRF